MRTDRIWQDHPIDRRVRAAMKHQRSCVLWFTGLSGAGKSTLAGMVEQQLVGMGAHTYLLDGDSLRQGLCRDLGFSPASRSENVRRIGELSRLMADAGLIVLVACISPYRQDRQLVRELLGHEEFIEVYVDAPLEECERRDPKGLYQKARAGEIADFTGIHAPYEVPAIPAVHLRTDVHSARECTDQAVDYLMVRGYVAG